MILVSQSPFNAAENQGPNYLTLRIPINRVNPNTSRGKLWEQTMRVATCKKRSLKTRLLMALGSLQLSVWCRNAENTLHFARSTFSLRDSGSPWRTSMVSWPSMTLSWWPSYPFPPWVSACGQGSLSLPLSPRIQLPQQQMSQARGLDAECRALGPKDPET